MKYLGLDVGSKNIGVAVGELISSELTTIRAPKDQDFYQAAGQMYAATQLEKLMSEQQADAIVIGLPVDDEQEMTKEATRIKGFGEFLAEKLDKKIHYTNETLTSFMAEDILEEQGLSIAEAKLRVDQLSAQLILQQYLEETGE